MEILSICGIVVALFVLFLSISYRKRLSNKVRHYKYNAYLDKQSFVVDAITGARLSHPVVDGKAPFFNLLTVCDLFEHGRSLSGNFNCFGTRTSTSDPYTWTTYNEVAKKVQLTRAILTQLITKNDERLTEDVMISIYSRNSPEWFIFAFAAAYEGYTTVPLYETFGDPACQHILIETKSSLVMCATVEQAKRLVQLAPSTLRHIIIISPEGEDIGNVATLSPSISIHVYDQLLKSAGAESTLSSSSTTVNPDSLYMVCYTSGSTGFPKGVMIRHRHFTTAIRNVCLRLEDKVITSDAVHVCYLPLSHILEQLASMATLLFGGSIGFLTKDITTLLADFAVLRPTHLFTVPRLLGRVHASVLGRLNNVPLLPIGRLLDFAVHQRYRQQAEGHYYTGGIWELLFFRRIRSALGGRVRVIVCGGAPISNKLLAFTRVAVSCPVLTGYGLTEACGMVSLAYFGDCSDVNTVGALIPGVMAKLVDVPEMDIYVKDKGIGEIHVKSPGCTDGYLYNPQHTASLIDADGWLRTGDIGTFTKTGALQLLGRCKSTFKLSQGEFVSPDRLEEAYQLCKLVTQVYVEGNSLHCFLVAVVVPNLEQLARAVRALGNGQVAAACSVEGADGHQASTGPNQVGDTEELCGSPVAKQLVLQALQQTGKGHGLKGFEQVKAVHLTPTPFTAENGLLTANGLKLARNRLRQHFDATIDNLYADVLSSKNNF